MPEFTWNGIVRHGFGFYNPNHAAALICAAFPFLLGWKRRPWIGILLAAALLVPLALTFSRTGLAVLVFESALLAVLKGGTARKTAIAAIALAIAVFGAFGVLGRFVPDAAAENRLHIWKAGLSLCAANPGGVGAGQSGKLVSAFLLDGIECRTLVNAHLTLLAERGAAVGFAWFAFVLSALFAGRRRPATLCAFAGMTVSALMSTVFDESRLLGFSDFGRYGVADFALSWTSALLYLGFGCRLASGGNRRDWLLASGCAALFSFLLPVCFADKAAPKVRNGCVVFGGAGAPLVLYDPSWTLSAMLPYLDEGFVMPLDPGDFSGPFDRIWYFGDAAEYSFSHPDARHTFFFPSEFFEPPSGTDSVVRE